MSSASFQPRLRLVGSDDATALPAHPRAASGPELEVVKENRLAAHAAHVESSHIDPRDPRWVLAQQTQARLQGAMLTPQRRDELLASGRRLGLRSFEANLVIAVVQDRARRRQPLRLADQSLGLIGMKPLPKATVVNRGPARLMLWWLAALSLAAIAAAAFVRWTTAS
jgi:hypothetical protein